MTSITDLQQSYGEDEAEQVQQRAHNEQDGSMSHTGAVQQEQVTGHQAAHQTRRPIEQLHSHHRLQETCTHTHTLLPHVFTNYKLEEQ